ncbi:PREDICTED: odorant receptor 4-like [Vollenhovia emeryi]|uniref:odorant receptor 4-like n=1 Tax=Vollenhovia emeryi TaxID=411798 RepID=UPI0005F37703|nr:PREDICTED: odorant receptor 4-like [Vollenhovia emeryi]
MTRKSTISRIVFLLLPWFGYSSNRLVILITRLFWIVTIAFIEFFHYLYVSTHLNSENFFNLVDCCSSFLAHAKVITKLVAFWINQRKFEETLVLITDDWDDCAKNDIGMRVMADKAKISARITNTILVLHTMTIVAYCLGVIIADADVTDQTIELPFVNKLEFPFSINTQRMYRFVLIAEFVHMIVCNWAAGVYNAILLSMVFHVGGQIDILQCWMAELTSNEMENKPESSIIAANKIILKHQKIIQFSENIESLYTYIALLLFASNTMLICSLGFLIVTAVGTADATEQIMKCLLFFTITNLEAFIFCYAGEYLNNKSREIGFATYNCAWYNFKSKDSRILLFIILRSQRQLTLTAGKMMDLTLQSFASIMNASGSYLSVLLAMQ